MHKLTQFSLIALTVAGLGWQAASRAQALTQFSQQQSFSQDLSSDCSGSCTQSLSSSSSQEQHFEINSSNSSSDSSNDNSNSWFSVSSTGNNLNRNRTAQIMVSWNNRGGTCNVRYTETTARNYKYHTSASCDQGNLTIGGLVRGRAYRFQIQQDNGTWSRAMRAVAW